MIVSLLAMLGALGTPQEQYGRLDEGTPAYWQGADGWRVFSYPDEGMCDLGLETESGEYVTIGLHGGGGVNLAITNRHATSLRVGEVRHLTVAFSSKPGDRPTSVHAVSFDVVDADGRIALAAARTYPTFLDDFARSGAMVVSTQRMGVVGAIVLKGTAEATAKLRACAASTAGVTLTDPFLK